MTACMQGRSAVSAVLQGDNMIGRQKVKMRECVSMEVRVCVLVGDIKAYL